MSKHKYLELKCNDFSSLMPATFMDLKRIELLHSTCP